MHQQDDDDRRGALSTATDPAEAEALWQRSRPHQQDVRGRPPPT